MGHFAVVASRRSVCNAGIEVGWIWVADGKVSDKREEARHARPKPDRRGRSLGLPQAGPR